MSECFVARQRAAGVRSAMTFILSGVGLTGLAVAFLLNHWTITHDSSRAAAYRPAAA